MTIRGSTTSLKNAIASAVSIPNSGQGFLGVVGLTALSGAKGSLTMSNSVANSVNNASGGSFTFNFVTNAIGVTIQTSLSGLSFAMDGTNYTSPRTFNLTPGSSHTISTSSPQNGGAGVQYAWSGWSDGGAISHVIAPLTSSTYTANFTTNYFLTMNAGSGGSVSPASFWTNRGESVNLTATPNPGYTFSNWLGSGDRGSLLRQQQCSFDHGGWADYRNCRLSARYPECEHERQFKRRNDLQHNSRFHVSSRHHNQPCPGHLDNGRRQHDQLGGNVLSVTFTVPVQSR